LIYRPTAGTDIRISNIGLKTDRMSYHVWKKNREKRGEYLGGLLAFAVRGSKKKSGLLEPQPLASSFLLSPLNQ